MARAGWVAACLALTAAVLAACNNMTSILGQSGLGQSGNEAPDAMDRVRAADLEPRFAAPEPTVRTGPKSGARASSYYGSTVPEAAAVVPTPSGGEGFELNFENTPVATVAKVILGDILGVGYTIDPRVQGTISLASGRPVPKGDILFVLENALRASNVALVHETAGYRLVPVAEAVGSGTVDHAVDGNRPEPGYGVTAIPLQHASVQTVTKLLDTFAMKAGSIRSDPARNILIVLGTGAERRAAVETVLSFDTDWMRGQSVGIYPVHNSPPEPMIAELEKIMDSGDGGLGQGMVKFQAVSRLNAILVVSRKPEFLRTAATWISRLDNSELASTGVKVYHIRYGDARQLARLLNEVFVGGSGGSSLDSAANQLAPGGGSASLSSTERLTGGAGSPTTSGLPTPTVSAGPSGASGGLGGSGLGAGGAQGSGSPASFASRASAIPGGFGETLAGARGGPGAGGSGTLTGVRITPDIVNNALLIYASADNYRIIERTLSQLDRPLLQVAIDLTVAEVTLNDQLNYGVQFFLESAKLGLPIDSGSVINSAAGAVLGQTLPGFNLLVGNAALPRVVINALHDYTDVKVLSNPSLVVVDNQSATLQVGDQVPITTGSATVLSTSNTVVNTISYQNTGIILHVSPRINANGRVLLDVEQEISSVDPTSATGTLTPTLSTRKVKSTISIMSGQTVLLAGLISNTQSRSRSGIPGLDQLPAIGDVFTQNQKQTQRTELIIFIRPQIIRDGADAAVIAEELRSKMRGSKIGSTHPPGAVVPRAPVVVQ
ncbi:MAG: type II secretion system secretin GspD [Xanthobacteraceae bacterium]